MLATSKRSRLASVAYAEPEANGAASTPPVRPVSDEYKRVWSELQRIRSLLCYCPTHRENLHREKSLQTRLKELEL